MSKNKISLLRMPDGTNYTLPFILITSLFFFWGFVHNIDPILIAHLRKTFELSHLQSTFVDVAVYAAYFLMAIPAGLVMRKYGYKSGILFGLGMFALGAFLFVPAANTHLYALFLGALFIIATGLTFLETAANPYASSLGPEETSTFRLNLAQSFNGLAAAVAPIAGKYLILSDGQSEAEVAGMTDTAKAAYLQAETASVKMPFIILGIVILLVAILFYFMKLPEIKDAETEDKGANKGFFHAFKHIHLRWAVIAEFFYIGAQVSVISLFVIFATDAVGMDSKTAANYQVIMGAAFLAGRFAGTTIMRFVAAQKLLGLYAAVCMVLCVVAMTASGLTTIYAIIAICFFMAIMFPTIFALGIKGLGADTKSASSLLVMSIVGGAILPPLFGYIADMTHNVQMGYIVPLVSFGVVLLFALKGTKPEKPTTPTLDFATKA